ncbi:MAG: hypothetical protein JNJ57_03765 [Saprospiraceae bacterium]|nr:hypothetical protein [Saprospiraceae bacterium]
MNSIVIPNLWRFVGMVLLQGLLLKQMGQAVHTTHFNVLLYPLFILFLPIQTAAPYLVLLGFAVGISVDIFYQTPGVHASAGAFSGFTRAFVFAAFSPKGGFSTKEPIFSPANVSWQTYLYGASAFFFLHLFWYFSVDAFTFVFFGSIMLKTIIAWFISMIFVVLYAALFNPKI